jgi:hypothetical protein
VPQQDLANNVIDQNKTSGESGNRTVNKPGISQPEFSLTTKLRHSRQNGTWPAMMMFEFP